MSEPGSATAALTERPVKSHEVTIAEAEVPRVRSAAIPRLTPVGIGFSSLFSARCLPQSE
jgi:hypothetical protein